MYAPGAIPDTRRPLTALTPRSPAAIPATWVPWKELGAFGSFAEAGEGFGGGNERATITFAVVYRRSPFGKPAGIVKPVGLKNGCFSSTPSSMMPIFIPW